MLNATMNSVTEMMVIAPPMNQNLPKSLKTNGAPLNAQFPGYKMSIAISHVGQQNVFGI